MAPRQLGLVPRAGIAAAGAALVHDGQRLLLIGGRFLGGRFLGYTGSLDDVWGFDGETWSRMNTPLRPAAFYPHFDNARVTAVWQTHRRRALVLVPQLATSLTYEWDGTAWTWRFPAVAPFGFDNPLAYDEARQRVVCVAAILGQSTTWEWDGNEWSAHGPAPQGTWGQALTYDPTRRRVVLVGGGDPDRTIYGGTFEWDGVRWQSVAGATVPARSSAGLVFDPARQRLVLIGGGRGNQWEAFDDAYELIGGTWQQRLAGTAWPGIAETTVAFDPVARRVIALGTLEDPCSLWSYGPVHAAHFAPFGAGCATNGLTLTADGLPWSGDTFAIALSALQPNAPAIIALGSSRASFLGLPLPFDLTPLGMTGCTLLASPDVPTAVANLGGTATLRVNLPALPGAHFYAQGFGIHPAANPVGMVLSNAGEGVIGSR